MAVLLSHTTALEALRDPRLRSRLAKGDRCAAELPNERPTREEVTRLLQCHPALTLPVHVLVAPAVNRRPRTDLRAHTSKAPLPAGSAIELEGGVLCVSPEHLLVQMAPRLTRLELIFLLGELLGTYAMAPGLEDGMFNRGAPLTTPELVRAHLSRLGTVPGVAQVRDALEVACVGSASPYETRLSMRLGLRPGLGGYHLRVLSMNEPLEVGRIVARLGAGVRKPDVFLGSTRADSPFSGVAFDYHGGVHREPRQIAYDLRRQNELLAIDFKPYALDKALYDDLDYMDGIVARARRDLGLPEEWLSEGERTRRRRLRQWLHDELERIDGVSWNGRERARRAATSPVPEYEPVPLEAYGLE